MSETGDLITRIYANFRGADFRGEEINLSRSPDCLNVWKDYRHTESIRTRAGMELLVDFNDTIYGLFFYCGALLVHCGDKLYSVINKNKTTLFTGLQRAKSEAFVYENIWYFKDGKHYLKYDGTKISEVEGYVPTTSIARKPVNHKKFESFKTDGETKKFELEWDNIDTDFEPIVKLNNNVITKYTIYYTKGVIEFNSPPEASADGEDNLTVEYKKTIDGSGGTTYEDVNMLSPKRINTFLADGDGDVFYLDALKIDTSFDPIVKVNDVVVTNYTVNYEKGCITFDKAPASPLTDGQDNVSIEFSKTVEGYPNRILECSLLQVFDNRVFVSGNPNYPNTVWHCSLNNPTYFSDLDYYREGMDSAQIKGLVAGNNALWVFREPSDSNTNVFYHTPSIDADYGKIYPSQHSSITTGCVGRAINFNDDIVFFSERGMEGISGDITTEQAVAHRSSLVDRKMIAENDYANMILEEWEGYLLVIIGDKIYLADSRAVFTNEDHIEYEWFYWEMEHTITSTRVNNGTLYLGTSKGVYTLTDTKCNVESFWVTPKDKFKSPHKLKTTNKRGCVAEATGDVSVYAKTEDTDFELIGTYENVTDYFVSRIKRKKWKDIQLKFYSNTRFSLETVTLEAFIGGYVKR